MRVALLVLLLLSTAASAQNFDYDFEVNEATPNQDQIVHLNEQAEVELAYRLECGMVGPPLEESASLELQLSGDAAFTIVDGSRQAIPLPTCTSSAQEGQGSFPIYLRLSPDAEGAAVHSVTITGQFNWTDATGPRTIDIAPFKIAKTAEYDSKITVVAGAHGQVTEDEISVPITVENFGNALTNVFWELQAVPAGVSVLPPREYLLDRPGGQISNHTDSMHIYSGHAKCGQTFQLIIVANATYVFDYNIKGAGMPVTIEFESASCLSMTRDGAPRGPVTLGVLGLLGGAGFVVYKKKFSN